MVLTNNAALLLLLIFVESSADFVHSEMMWRGIVLNVQPSPRNKSCAKDVLLYTKRKGANRTACSLWFA